MSTGKRMKTGLLSLWITGEDCTDRTLKIRVQSNSKIMRKKWQQVRFILRGFPVNLSWGYSARKKLGFRSTRRRKNRLCLDRLVRWTTSKPTKVTSWILQSKTEGWTNCRSKVLSKSRRGRKSSSDLLWWGSSRASWRTTGWQSWTRGELRWSHLLSWVVSWWVLEPAHTNSTRSWLLRGLAMIWRRGTRGMTGAVCLVCWISLVIWGVGLLLRGRVVLWIISWWHRGGRGLSGIDGDILDVILVDHFGCNNRVDDHFF